MGLRCTVHDGGVGMKIHGFLRKACGRASGGRLRQGLVDGLSRFMRAHGWVLHGVGQIVPVGAANF